MRRLALLVAFTAFTVAALAVRGALPTAAGPNCTVDASIDSEEAQFLLLINQHRQNNGLAPLQLSDTLNKAAAWKSKDMADNNYFDHKDLPINREWYERVRNCGYTYAVWIGENIAAGNSTAQATFNQWLNSPDHNANMLNANYAAIGIGRAYNASSTYRWYWTTDFGGFADGYTPPGPTPTPTPPLPPASGIDSDGDGCDDAYETSADLSHGGGRDPDNPWDFFDTPDAANVRDAAITVADLTRVVARFGASGDLTLPLFSPPSPPPAYHTAFDRTPNGPVTASANGSITASDISLLVAQFGHTCA